jgi:hypothetical protein
MPRYDQLAGGNRSGEASVIVDCDAHVMEPADLWTRYLDPEFRDRAIRIEVVDGVEQLVLGEVVVLSARLAGLGGAHLDRARVFSGELRYADGCPPASYDPAERVRLMDEWGVDVGVLFPTIGILPFPELDAPLANAYCRAYNRWQISVPRSAGASRRSPSSTGTSMRRRASSTAASRRVSAVSSCPRRRLPASGRAARASIRCGAGARRPESRRACT